MRSAYNTHSEVDCFLSPNLHRKAGLALAFIAFGSIAGASGVVVQMAGHEPNADGRSVIAAIPLNPSDAQLVSTGVLRRKASSWICLTRKSATSAREMNPHVQRRGSTNAR